MMMSNWAKKSNSIRLLPGMLTRLKQIARERSEGACRPVAWCEIVRELVAKYFAELDEAKSKMN
jgi:hypothetical protein